MPSSIDLDIDAPEKFPIVLEIAAQFYRDSRSELASAWTDPSAGKIWEDFAKICDRAAASARKAIANRLG